MVALFCLKGLFCSLSVISNVVLPQDAVNIGTGCSQLKHDTLLPTWLEEFKQYEHIKTLERRVVVELIDHIDVHSKTEIEIHFCFEDELHSITEKFMEYQAHHGNEVAEE